MSFQSDTIGNITLKKLFNKTQTQNSIGLGTEKNYTNVSISNNTIFGETVPATIISPNGYSHVNLDPEWTTYPSVNPLVQKVRFSLQEVEGSDGHAYHLVFPSSSLHSSISSFADTKLSDAKGAVQLVPPALGDDPSTYAPFVGNVNGGQITYLDSMPVYIDYFAGIYFRESLDNEGAFSRAPTFIIAYVYLGKMANEVAPISSAQIDASNQIELTLSNADVVTVSGPVQGPQGLRGATGIAGPTGSKGQTGATGPQGSTGATGIAGPRGVTGSQGVTGPQGIQGVTGPTGSKGETGAAGTRGQTGPQGAQGVTGLQGTTGAQGIQGSTGADGSAGSQGPRGEAFSVDEFGELDDAKVATIESSNASATDVYFFVVTSDTRSTSIKSSMSLTNDLSLHVIMWNGSTWSDFGQFTGLKGDTGATGAIGAQGIQGITGARGETGSTGLQGPTGSIGLQGPTGAQGPIGVTGTQGSAGVAGAKGETGAAGIQGATGPQGITGVTGAVGAKGETGTTGLQGVTGPTGITGATGIAGPTGPQGTTGSQGIEGPRGPTGFQGIQGSQGVTGAQGVAGITGSTGAQGETGATGSKGQTGATGVQGATGAVGATGSQGIQGVTGSQGPTGAAGAGADNSTIATTLSTHTTFIANVAGNSTLQSEVKDDLAADSTFQNNVKGDTGATGATGTTGARGPTGAAGANASNSTIAATLSSDNTFVGNVAANSTLKTNVKNELASDTDFQADVKGATGSQGVAGPTGTQGATGPTGARGLTGPVVAATSSILGGIKVGTNLSIDSTTSILSSTDTKYTAATSGGLGLTGTAFSISDNYKFTEISPAANYATGSALTEALKLLDIQVATNASDIDTLEIRDGGLFEEDADSVYYPSKIKISGHLGPFRIDLDQIITNSGCGHIIFFGTGSKRHEDRHFKVLKDGNDYHTIFTGTTL